MQSKITGDVEEMGFSTIGVFADEDDPRFTYSIGFWRTHEQPEVIIFGIQNETAHGLLWGVHELMQNGEAFAEGTRDDVLADFPAYFLPVPWAKARAYACQGVFWYEPERFPLLQLVWPDEEGNFPWDDGYDKRYASSGIQPVLGRAPIGGGQ